MRDGVYIVATCRDGSLRLFAWEVAGEGPLNTWSILSRIVDRNLSFNEREARRFDIVGIQAAKLEPLEASIGDRA